MQVAGGCQPGLDGVLHVGTQVVCGQCRWPGGESGIRFDGQLIAGQVRR
jgi:hypothetical protein